jgi:hypothetical protein
VQAQPSEEGPGEPWRFYAGGSGGHYKTKSGPGGWQMSQSNEEIDEPYVLTVGALKKYIQALDDDVEIYFGQTKSGPVRFYRLKMRDPKLLQFEFATDEDLWG